MSRGNTKHDSTLCQIIIINATKFFMRSTSLTLLPVFIKPIFLINVLFSNKPSISSHVVAFTLEPARDGLMSEIKHYDRHMAPRFNFLLKARINGYTQWRKHGMCRMHRLHNSFVTTTTKNIIMYKHNNDLYIQHA